MAESTSGARGQPPPIVDVMQAGLRQALASGTIPVETEVELRAQFADLLIRQYGRYQRPQDIHDAIDHNETILRRLPQNSPRRLQHLDSLSYARMSEYGIAHSKRALDEAVRFGRQARQEAVAVGLLETNPHLYFSILNNAGYALSQRNAAVESAADLDEAITYAREIKQLASKESREYSMAIANLISRLSIRYSTRNDPADLEETMQLITEQLSMSTPGTMLHGMAILQLGKMAMEKFQRTNTMEDLDEALRQLNAGLATIPHGHENRVQVLDIICRLYSSRHKKTDDIADIQNAVQFSDMLVGAMPPSHEVRGTYLWTHMRCLRDFVMSTTSIQEVEKAISMGNRRLSEMPVDYPRRHDCRWTFSHVLGCKYILSQKLESLIDALEFVATVCDQFNDLVKKSGTQAPVDTSLIYSLLRNVRDLSQTHDGEAKTLASQKLHEYVTSACRSKDFISSLLVIQKEHEQRLKVYIDAAKAGEVLSDEEVNKRASESERKERAKREERNSRPIWRPKSYQTELGLRQLAIDPTNGKIVLDISGIMQDILGFDPSESVSAEEFVAREARLEKENFDKARAEGKNPNPMLCWMCRLVKPLRPTLGGFIWGSEGMFMPFGSWHQLNCRRWCSICGLILSLITSEQQSNSLHPHLAAIDREIQGTGLEPAKLSTGETVLKLEYGMRRVGELRILTPDSYLDALRQGWEARDQSLQFPEILDTDEGPVHSRNRQRVDFTQLKHWLNNCDHNHGQVCNSYRGGGPRYAADIPMLFIDVIDQCLVQAPSAVKYFALSYVWGASVMPKTLRSNYEARLIKGGLPRQLPDTIADAIQLVCSLGERYLWVDALCIVQDDEKHKEHNIKQMDIVYSKAFATIVAMHGSNAEAGLPGVRNGTRLPQNIQSVVISGKSKDLECDPESNEKETVYMVATPTLLHLAQEVSTWDTRGWILQERLLSRRCLCFTDRYVYFQCGREVVSESGVNEPLRPQPDLGSQGEPGKKTFALPTVIDNPISDLQKVVDYAPELQLFKSFATYTKLIEMYTKRKLSFESDILHALSGMLAVLNEHFQTDILSGLPASALDLALLWAPAAKLPRRGCKLPTMEDFEMGQVDRNFPSWSWAGWTGPIDYRFVAQSAEELLPTPLVDSYTTNVDGKLLTVHARSSTKGTASASGSDNADASQLVEPPPPDLAPKVLQFTAPCVRLSAFTIPPGREYLSTREHIHTTSTQSVRHILDPHGKRCGLWWEQAGYVYIGRNMSLEAESKMLMVGISQYGDVFHRRKGPNRVEGEIEMFDVDVYPPVGKGSGLVNVLVIDLDMGHQYAERITVARIHAKAWEEAGPQMMLIRLA